MGAELCSVCHTNGIEYMWQAEAAWPKHSPVLFPIVGTLVNNTYYYQQQAYHLPRHGFAREMRFIPTLLSETEALFTLCSNANTLAVYPFHFRLHLHYHLHHDTLTCTYMVENTSNTEMYFSIGGHPAFAVPMIEKMVHLLAISDRKFLILVTVCSYLVFALFYIIVYMVTSKQYYKIVSGKQEESLFS